MHHHGDAGLWELRIRLVSMSDSGLYECQANSSPKRSSSILLSVEDTAAVIAGPVHRYVPAGQELKLVCLVNLGPAGHPQTDTEEYRQTAVLHWLLDRRLLESSDNGRIKIESGDVGDSFQVDSEVHKNIFNLLP